jgi:hypothetical protein
MDLLARLGAIARADQSQNSVVGLSAGVGLCSIQAIKPSAGMGIDDLQGCRLLGEMTKNRYKHQMFEDIRMIAGMKGMAIAEHGG